MSNRSKCLLIVTPILLLKTISNKTQRIALNRAIRAGLDLVDPLAHDRNSRRRTMNKILSVGMCKRSNHLEHSKMLLRISNNISICGRLRKKGARTRRLIRHRGRRCKTW
jgi:hypothetical protein